MSTAVGVWAMPKLQAKKWTETCHLIWLPFETFAVHLNFLFRNFYLSWKTFAPARRGTCTFISIGTNGLKIFHGFLQSKRGWVAKHAQLHVLKSPAGQNFVPVGMLPGFCFGTIFHLCHMILITWQGESSSDKCMKCGSTLGFGAQAVFGAAREHNLA